MNPAWMVLPSLAMFALTLGVILYMGWSRYHAIHSQEVRISFFRTYDEGSQPARLHLLSRHVQNHFEVPPLLHIGVLLSVATDAVTAPGVICAWGFVAARAVHSVIHLGGNNVSRRFFTFGVSLLMLLGVWAALAVETFRRLA